MHFQKILGIWGDHKNILVPLLLLLFLDFPTSVLASPIWNDHTF